MSEFLGCRISLISKSDIRYVGTLHDINSAESTVSLENVMSFGTEGRKPGEDIGPSEQIYEYIVFRGSDVKDLRIEQRPGMKDSKPPAVPNDPAIVGSGVRPAVPQGSVRQGSPGQASPGPGILGQPPPPVQAPLAGPPPPGPDNFGPPPSYPNNFYGGPPLPGPWTRGIPGPVPHGGPPQFGSMSYPPPPDWMQGPGGPGPWNSNYSYPPPGFGGPDPNVHPDNGHRGPSGQESKPSPIGPAAADRSANTSEIKPSSLAEAPGDARIPVPAPARAPPPPVETKPSVEEVKAAIEARRAPAAAKQAIVPTGPKNARIIPATPLVPIPKPAPPSASAENDTAQVAVSGTGRTLKDATQSARAAVALAMAQIAAQTSAQASAQASQPGQQKDLVAAANDNTGQSGRGPASGGGPSVDNLANRVSEMRVNAANANANGNAARGSYPGGGRVRGRGGRPHHNQRLEVPDSDFDFERANAKFNKDFVKDALVGGDDGSPRTESAVEDQPEPPQQAYNKTRSFFDNIGSEAKDRAENPGQRPGGREWRHEETNKNFETFGEGSADGGYARRRGGRGRGFRGRGSHGYGYGRRGGGGGGFRHHDSQQAD